MTVRNKPEKRQRPEPHNSSRMRRFIQRARTEGTDLENAGSTVHGVERDRNDLEVPTRTPADHPRPDFGVRLLSLSIDYGLILAYLAVLVLVALGGYALTRSLHDWLSLGTAGAELLGFVFLVLPVGIYLYLGEASERQATVGKRLLSLRVVDAATGGRLAKPRVLVRTIVKLLPWEVAHFFVWQAVALTATGATDFPAWLSVGMVVANVLPVLYVVMVLVQRDHRGPHDLMARSKVIHIRNVGAAADRTVDGSRRRSKELKMSGHRIGSVIAAVFGLIDAFVNTVALPVEWAWPLRGLAVAVFAAVLIALVRTGRFAGTAAASTAAFGMPTSEPTYAEARKS